MSDDPLSQRPQRWEMLTTAEACMKWKDAVRQAIVRVAIGRPGRVFSLAELREAELTRIVRETGSRGATPERTLERECQELRDIGFIEFVDNDGTYRLR